MMNMNMGMGGVGTPVGMDGAAGGPSAGSSGPPNQRERHMLNTYIYDYFLKHDMLDCAKALLKTSDVAIDRPQDRTKHEGNMNGVNDPMDTGDDSRNDNFEDAKNVRDLPPAQVPTKAGQTAGGGFLLEWWYCFMDIYFARTRTGGGGSQAAQAYIHQVSRVAMIDEKRSGR